MLGSVPSPRVPLPLRGGCYLLTYFFPVMVSDGCDVPGETAALNRGVRRAPKAKWSVYKRILASRGAAKTKAHNGKRRAATKDLTVAPRIVIIKCAQRYGQSKGPGTLGTDRDGLKLPRACSMHVLRRDRGT